MSTPEFVEHVRVELLRAFEWMLAHNRWMCEREPHEPEPWGIMYPSKAAYYVRAQLRRLNRRDTLQVEVECGADMDARTIWYRFHLVGRPDLEIVTVADIARLLDVRDPFWP